MADATLPEGVMPDAAVPEVTLSDVQAAAPQIAVMVVALAAFVWMAGRVVRRMRAGQTILPVRPQAAVPWDVEDVGLVALVYFAGSVVMGTGAAGKPLVDRLVDNIVLSLGTTLAAMAWLMFRGATRTTLGFVGGHFREDLRIATGSLALVVFPLLTLAAVLNAVVRYKHVIVDFLGGQRSGAAVALVIASAVVVAPVAEEFFFRRVLQGWLQKHFSGDALRAVVVSSLAFAAAHAGQGLAYVPLFPLAMVLGFLAARTGSIVPSILLHALFNAVSVMLLLVQPAAGTG
jgi:membrane protease YdiL (CAAX protease family)